MTWALVYWINAIVPFALGLAVTGGAGLVGMLLGLALMFGAAGRLTAVSREFKIAFEVGGWIVAASQLFPVLQVLAGAIGLRAAAGWRQAADHSPMISANGVLGGFIATVGTGGILMTFAMGIGMLVGWIRSLRDRR